MSFNNFQQRSLVILFIVVLPLLGCKQPKPKVIKSPPHYNFSETNIAKLDDRLKEISGIAWDADRDEFYAHYDETGKLFILDKSSLSIKPPSPFSISGKGDFEDIAIYNGTPYMLESSGKIIKIVRDSMNMSGVELGELSISGTNDFETLYADSARKALIMVCKNCEMDKKTPYVSAFAYYPDSIGFDTKPVFRMNADSIKALAERNGLKKPQRFQPSAASIHPILKKLFIISSASRQLVVADLNGQAEGVYELGKIKFPQPEGLTFKRIGDMYISNEGVTSKGTVHRFVYKN